MAGALTVLLMHHSGSAEAPELRRRLEAGDWGAAITVRGTWDVEGVDAQIGLVDEADLVVALSHPANDVPAAVLERVEARLDAEDVAAVTLNGTGASLVRPRPDRFVALDADDLARVLRPRALFRFDAPLVNEAAWDEACTALRRVVIGLVTPPLSGVSVENLGAIRACSIRLSPGINVLLGSNGAGKSWLMKVLYAVLGAGVAHPQPGTLSAPLAERLVRLFRPEDGQIGRLVRRPASSSVVRVDRDRGELAFTLVGDGQLNVDAFVPPPDRSAVFIPSRESLAMFDGFMPLYNKYGLSFDGTYADLCEILATPELRSERGALARSILSDLESMLGGQIRLKGGHFVRVSGGQELEAHLLSEGQRKVATLARLVKNGTLSRGSVLFWDEPEANMNPRFISRFADILDKLGRLGVQIILATHDHLLAQRLSLGAEYDTALTPRQFISFYQDGDEGFTTETSPTLAGLVHNNILDEYAALFDEERVLALGRLAD